MIHRKWFLGIDWGRERHQACVMDATGEVLGNKSFVHSGTGLAQLVQWCVERTGEAVTQIAAAIEVPHGAVVDTLQTAGFVVHSINPKQLSRFRDRHSPSGAKDDRRDAMVLADALRTDPKAFRALDAQDEHSFKLRGLLQSYEQLTKERVRLLHQCTDLLNDYYPQFLQLGADLTRFWVMALWQKLPTPKKAQRVQVKTVEKLLRRHGARKRSAEQVLAVLRQQSLEVPDTAVDVYVSQIKLLVEQLELIQRQYKRVTRDLDQCLDALSKSNDCGTPEQDARPADAAIIQSLPGAGRMVTATLLAKAGDAIEDRNYQALRCLSGVAPVTQQSGKTIRVNRRRAVDSSVSDAAYHLARIAMQHDPISRSKYRSLRERGHTHGRALRGVADRLLYVACAMLRNGTLFEARTPSHDHSVAHAA